MWSWLKGNKEGNKEGKQTTSSSSDSNGGGLFNFGGKMAYKKQAVTRPSADYDHLFKLLLVGDSGVGKSCLLLRFHDGSFFSESFISTIGVDFKVKTLDIDGRRIKLQIWDTTGQERFRTITSSYYRGAHGVLLVYDRTNETSFRNVRNWADEVERYANPNVVKVIIGNKCDLSSSVDLDSARALADSTGSEFYETSAKTGEGVEEPFLGCVRAILRSHEEEGGARPPVMPTPSTTTATKIDDRSDDSGSSDDESFSEDDLETDMAQLVEKSDAKVRAKGTKKQAAAEKEKKKKHKRTDVNVFRLDLTNLEKETELMTGDPVVCKQCGVMLSSHSKITEMSKAELTEKLAANSANKASLITAPPITEKYMYLFEVSGDDTPGTDSDEQIQCWQCEFCGNINKVNLDLEEVPHASVVDYVVSAPAAVDKEGNSMEDCNVVFCIDISGSMCVTQEVPGTHQLKGTAQREKEIRELSQGEGMQYMPGQQRNVTHVSRLQCVQAAIEAQIEKLAQEHPNKRVSLVTFNNEVTLLGDGEQESVVVAGEKLDSWNDLVALGQGFHIRKTVKESKDELLKKLWSLEENGATALGPALLLSTIIAGARPRSTVVLYTDGLANVGVGSLEGKESDYTPFYTECAEQAKLRGVAVSVITLTGTDCNVENLSVVTEQTGGQVDRVDALEIANNLSSVFSTRVLAYGVMAMVLLHRGLQFQGEMDDEQENRNWVVKDLANVTADTECSFSYGFRPKTECDLTGLTNVPFQVQLLFTRPDGMQFLRVATTCVPLTDDRQQAELNADIKVIGQYASNRAARYAKQGDYEAAQLEARAAQRFMLRNNIETKTVKNWSKQVESMDKVLRTEQKTEKERGLTVQDKKMRKKGRSDATSAAISKML